MLSPGAREFRTDINGLRAYAVILVLGYHFMLPGFGSGFAGVDIFFVISGFLMASIILPRLEAGRFSLTKFYAARLRRIFPALAVLCLALLGFGWFYLGPTDYERLGTHASASLEFISNFTYRDEEGYFDAPSREKWLLHTWSLSVEAQFYLLFPILLVALRRNRARVLWGIAIVSFGLSAFLTASEPATSFYLLPMRAWELLAGSLLFVTGWKPRRPERTMWLGIGMIASSAFLFGHVPHWPGVFPLWPVMGTVLVLAAANQQWFVTRNTPAQAIGLWSYSVYLWHWPLVVGLAYFGIAPSVKLALLAIAASILLGALSYRLVELPARRWGERNGPKRVLWASLLALLVISGAGIAIAHSKGFPLRLPEHIRQVDAERDNRAVFDTDCGFDRRTKKLVPCVIGNKDDIGFVLWGDSHAGSIASALRDSTKRGILYFTHACATQFDAELRNKGTRNHCREFNAQVLELVRALPKNVKVVVANRYATTLHGDNAGNNEPYGMIYYNEPMEGDPTTLWQQHLGNSLCHIAKTHRTYVVLPQPEIGIDVPRVMTRHLVTEDTAPEISLPFAEYEARNRDVMPALRGAAKRCPNIRLLDPVPYLCPGKKSCMGSRDGMPLYIDDDHVSERGNRLLLPMFKKGLTR